MSQIVAFTKRLDFKTLLDIECKSLTGFAPVVKDSVDEFQSMLGLLGDIDVLIVDEPSAKNDYNFLVKAINEKGSSVKNIIMLSDQTGDVKNSTVFSLDKVESLISHLKSIVAPDAKETTGYISVPTDALIHFKILPFDLYIKISEGKFLKRIPANEDIDESTVNAFKAKGITDLYFEKKFNRDFSLLLLNNMINKVERNYTTEDEKHKAVNEVFVTTKELVQSVGLPPRVIEVCESMMESISTDVMKGKDKFSNYLTQMKDKSSVSFQYRFVELTSFISTQIVENLKEADKDEQIKKIVFAAFFCDISLSDSSHLDFRSEESIKDLWPEDKKAISEHALKSSQIAVKYKNAPQDADIIIKQHHGSPDGIGLGPVSMSILPLAKCLIASQELAFAILKESDKAPETVINNVVSRFAGTPIHSYLVLFEKSCKGNL
jgi:hypothetical protein